MNKKEYYQKHKEEYLRRSKERKAKVRSFILSYKDNPCMDCGIKYPWYVMQFDHRNPDTKEFIISKLAWAGKTLVEIEEEINKCDLVCANCHAIRTYSRAH